MNPGSNSRTLPAATVAMKPTSHKCQAVILKFEKRRVGEETVNYCDLQRFLQRVTENCLLTLLSMSMRALWSTYGGGGGGGVNIGLAKSPLSRATWRADRK